MSVLVTMGTLRISKPREGTDIHKVKKQVGRYLSKSQFVEGHSRLLFVIISYKKGKENRYMHICNDLSCAS